MMRAFSENEFTKNGAKRYRQAGVIVMGAREFMMDYACFLSARSVFMLVFFCTNKRKVGRIIHF